MKKIVFVEMIISFLVFACTSVAAEWKSPFDGPCVNVHQHLLTPQITSLKAVEEILQQEISFLAKHQVITCLICGGGPPDSRGIPQEEEKTNNSVPEMVNRIARQYPGFLVGIGWINLDSGHAPQQVDYYHSIGFKGLKFHRSNFDYSDSRYRPIFEKAAQLGMTCVFHTNTSEHDLRVHPVRVDRLQREIKGLNVIAYHLANPNFEVAGELMLKNQNMFFEMSGITSRMIEEHYLGPEIGRLMILDKLKNAFWHRQMWGQLIFASDGGLGQIPMTTASEKSKQSDKKTINPSSFNGPERVLRYKEYYRDWLETLKVPEELQYKIMYDNAAKLFGLPERPGQKKNNNYPKSKLSEK